MIVIVIECDFLGCSLQEAVVQRGIEVCGRGAEQLLWEIEDGDRSASSDGDLGERASDAVTEARKTSTRMLALILEEAYRIDILSTNCSNWCRWTGRAR